MPDSGMTCGLPKALSVMVMLPVRAPAAVGVKVIVKVQDDADAALCWGGRAVPQLPLSAKSPFTTTLPRFSV
jgi:hypothetical protein